MFHYFYLFTYLVALINTIIRPKLSQIKALKYGTDRGFPVSLIIFVRITQHFTLYSQLLLIIALFTGHNEIAASAQILETVVLLLYHIMIQRPTLLAYYEDFDKNVLDIVTSYTSPQEKKYFILWLGLHIQHTIAPLHLFIFKRHIHLKNDQYIATSTYLLILYGIWSFFCWFIQGHPVYPFQKTLRRSGPFYEILFYGSVIILCQIINYILVYYDNY